MDELKDVKIVARGALDGGVPTHAHAVLRGIRGDCHSEGSTVKRQERHHLECMVWQRPAATDNMDNSIPRTISSVHTRRFYPVHDNITASQKFSHENLSYHLAQRSIAHKYPKGVIIFSYSNLFRTYPTTIYNPCFHSPTTTCSVFPSALSFFSRWNSTVAVRHVTFLSS